MARSATLQGEVVIEQLVVTVSAQLPSGSIGNTDIEAGAGVDASKLDHHQNVPAYLNGAASSKTILAYRVPSTGTITDFWAGAVTVPTGSATVAVDLKKNGTTVLSAAISLDSGSVSRVAEEAALSVTAVVANDLLEVVLTATTPGSDTTASDVYASIGLDEEYPT